MTKSDMVSLDMMRAITKTLHEMHELSKDASSVDISTMAADEIMILQIGSFGYEHVKTLVTDPKEIADIEFMENLWDRIYKDWDRK